MRLDKYLCDCTGCTRKEAKQMIKSGRVQINGEQEKSPERKLADEDVMLDGTCLNHEKFHYFMMNKRAGVVTATTDEVHLTVFEHWDEPGRDYFPVGRLDKDTEGLLLITNDGELGHRLTSPAHHVEKMYYVETAKLINRNVIQMFREGMDIGEKRVLAPAILNILSDKSAYITIQEGKYHQIKRMFEKTGNVVTYLKRLRMGTLRLDESLAAGEYRELTIEEREELLKGWQRKSIMQ